MAYKELGAGGERLNAGDLNLLIGRYKMKAHASFSNKITDAGSISSTPLLLFFESATIHFLLESIERKSFYNDGREMALVESWDQGGPIPSDIQDVDIKYLDTGTSVTSTVRNRDDNISNPFLLKKIQKDGFYLEYWYTYTMLTIDLTPQDPNGYYSVEDILDSSSSSVTGLTNTTIRVSYGNYNVIQSPNAVQNKELDSNFTNVLEKAFVYNTNMITQVGNGKKDWYLRVDNIFIDSKINYFKLAVVNDNATISGISIEGYGASTPTGLILLDHSIISLTSGKYVHELIYSFEPAVNQFQDDVTLTFDYWPAYLKGSSTYVYYGSVIVLPNSSKEFGYGYPTFLDSIADDTPLTNILLTFMNEILKFSIYNYIPQNYVQVYNGDDVSFFKSATGSQTFNDGDFNTYLTAAGAYYHLLDMLSFNDGQEISWDIQYVK